MKEFFPEKRFQLTFGGQIRQTEVLKDIKDDHDNEGRILMAYSNYQLFNEIEHGNIY